MVRVTDADVADDQNGAPFLVMDLLEGADLEQVCGATPQPPALVVEWLRQVARGLDKAHRLGLVHRDLKPENIFLTHRDDGTPLIKVLDFGMVKNVGQAGHATRNGQLLGTPLYMSPQQVDGGQTPMSPGYCHALGLIAYRLLTGRHDRSGDSLLQVLRDVTTTVQTPSSRGANLGKDFDKWFLKACALDPRDRFPSAGEQVEALAVALGLPARTTESSGAVRASSLPGPLSSALEAAPALTATATSVATKGKPRKVPILLTVAMPGLVGLVGGHRADASPFRRDGLIVGVIDNRAAPRFLGSAGDAVDAARVRLHTAAGRLLAICARVHPAPTSHTVQATCSSRFRHTRPGPAGRPEVALRHLIATAGARGQAATSEILPAACACWPGSALSGCPRKRDAARRYERVPRRF